MPVPPPSPDQLVDFYVRLSNATEGADSLARQERDLQEWAARESLTVRTVWTDNGRSGYTNVRRDGFDSALAALTSGEVGTLAVWKLDRLSRRGAGQVGLVLDQIEKTGGRIVAIQDPIDTSHGNQARIPIMVLSEMARAESANTSARVRSRKDADRRAGRYLGGSAPLGYALDENRHLRPHPTEFALMRELVQRVTEGESLLTVARDWNARRIPTRRSGSWRPNTLSHSLRSPALAGHMTTTAPDGSVTAYRHPDTGEHVSLIAEGFEPIASASQQARVLAIMDGRLRRYGRGSRVVRQPRSLLGSLTKCAGCGRSLTTFGASYRCRKSFHDGADCPSPVSVSVSVLDEAVRRAWSRRLAALEPDDEVLVRIGEKWLQKFDPAPLQERAALAAEVEDTKARIAQADNDRYLTGTLDAERHARVTDALGRRLSALRARLADLPAPEADLGALLDADLSLAAIEEAPATEARDLLALSLVAVTVSAAPRRGARFVPSDRLTFEWIG